MFVVGLVRKCGTCFLSKRKRSGCPSKTNVAKRELERNPCVTGSLLKESKSGVSGEVLVCMVSRCAHELEYTSHYPVKKTKLSNALKLHTVAFADGYLTWPEKKWLDILWSDGTTFGNVH